MLPVSKCPSVSCCENVKQIAKELLQFFSLAVKPKHKQKLFRKNYKTSSCQTNLHQVTCELFAKATFIGGGNNYAKAFKHKASLQKIDSVTCL